MRRTTAFLLVIGFLGASVAAAEERRAPADGAATGEGDDCASLAWSCESSDEVSKARARCSCGDADGACARAACSQAETHPSRAVRREQALRRREVEACLRQEHGTARSSNPPKK